MGDLKKGKPAGMSALMNNHKQIELDSRQRRVRMQGNKKRSRELDVKPLERKVAGEKEGGAVAGAIVALDAIGNFDDLWFVGQTIAQSQVGYAVVKSQQGTFPNVGFVPSSAQTRFGMIIKLEEKEGTPRASASANILLTGMFGETPESLAEEEGLPTRAVLQNVSFGMGDASGWSRGTGFDLTFTPGTMEGNAGISEDPATHYMTFGFRGHITHGKGLKPQNRHPDRNRKTLVGDINGFIKVNADKDEQITHLHISNLRPGAKIEYENGRPAPTITVNVL